MRKRSGGGPIGFVRRETTVLSAAVDLNVVDREAPTVSQYLLLPIARKAMPPEVIAVVEAVTVCKQRGAVAVEQFADDRSAGAPIHFQAIPVVGLPGLADGAEVGEAPSAVVLEDELTGVGSGHQRQRSGGAAPKPK